MGINVGAVSTSGWYTDQDGTINFPSIATNGWGIDDQPIAVESSRRSEWSIKPDGEDPKQIRRAFQRINAILTDLSELYDLATIDETGIIVRTDVASWDAREIEAGTGIAVTNGDAIADNPVIALSHLGLEDLTDPDADRVYFWDESEDASKWLTVSTGLQITGTNITTKDSEIDHDSLLNFVSDEHVAHSGVSVIAGTLLTGGGTIDGNVTLNVDQASIDHGSIAGLSDVADHPGYLTNDGTRSGSSSQAQDFSTNGIKSDVVAESTATNGVAVDGLTIKDAGFAIGSDADGDIYYRASGALARLAKGSATQVLTMNAGATAPEWAASSGASVSDIESLRDADMALFFLVDSNAQAADGYMFDNFNDEAQVDTANCINQSYDSGGDFYEPTNTRAKIDSWSESNRDNYDALQSLTVTGAGQAFTIGDAHNAGSVKFYLSKEGSPTGNAVAKIYGVTGTVGSTAVPTGAALGTSENFDVSTLTGSYILVEFTFTGGVSLSAGDYAVVLEYTGGDGSNRVFVGFDEGGGHSGNSTRYEVGTGWVTYAATSWPNQDFCFYLYELASYNNMTLISEQRTAAASPSISRLSVFAEAVDSITINTDLIGYVSEDDGSTWDEVTLAAVATVGTGDDEDIIQYSGDETLSAGSGTTMVWKVVTDNNKHVRIHAVGQRWRTS